MIDLKQRLEPLTEEVAAKVIDGEAILINLATGVYYSMDKVGALIWQMIADNHTLEQTVSAVLQRYDVSVDRASDDVRRVAGELLEEKLVRLVEQKAVVEALPPDSATGKEPYEPPALNIYRDMGDLLALDPPTPGLDTFNWKDPDEESK